MSTPEKDQDQNAEKINKVRHDYWTKNLRLIGLCLVAWFMASIGFSILLRPALSDIKIGGTDIGFWFAQQGSILSFVVIIFFYAWRMNKIDHEFNVDDDNE